MAGKDRILAIDIGATSIKVGEFEYPSRDSRVLVNFAHREYEEELTEGTRSVVVAGLLRQMVVESNFHARRALVCMSGQAAFTRFVKLPPFAEDEKRIRQIVEFEAKQNVPFNMDEVIWDYQLIANPDEEEMDVMFVVIKNEIVEQMTGAVQAVGLEPLLVDVAPAACYNAARANRVGEDECAMVLNIGGRSTNLLFADRSRFFARTIPIAGHSITQQVAKEFGIGFAEAEELKRRHGFVALGGAYAEPESEVAAAVSKIIRNVMARLHGEINRSISVYRAQQHGNRPTHLFLTGGSSTMTYCDHFFAEKLHLDVTYFNPFQVVGIGPAINRQRLGEVAHMFSEVIGLGLRYKLPCPIEVTLVPENIRRQQALKRKKPFVFAAEACVLIILLVGWFGALNRGKIDAQALDAVTRQRQDVEGLYNKIKAYSGEAGQRLSQHNAISELLEERWRWPDVFNEMYRLKPDNLWFHSIQPIVGDVLPITAASTGAGGMGMDSVLGSSGMGDMGMEGGGSEMGGGGFPAAPMEGGFSGMDSSGMGSEEMGGFGMGGGVAVATYEARSISGLILSGHGVILGAGDAGRAIEDAAEDLKEGEKKPEPRRKEPRKPEPKAEAEDGEADEDAFDELSEAEKAPAKEAEEEEPEPAEEEETPEERMAKARERARTKGTPELAFLEVLRASELVDPDGEYTGIKSYVPPQDIDNLSSFVIQVKFKEPFDYQHLSR
ncbi:MAG: type IV pilus assembly protein PilM [Lentisphaeria bacterium]|nr:type IV pilus assembly protein PilM [Lentisphaeria bacterium]